MTTTVTTNDFTEIERLAKEGAVVFQGAPSIMQSMQLAETVEWLRAELTPARLAKVKALMHTSLGFDTDRNPAKWTRPEPPVPYSDDVIRDVFIEASLRGFYPINCEFNIIAGRFYGGVNGFERLVKKHADVTDFKDDYGIPTMSGEKGAIIECSATWRQRGEPQSLARKFAVRVNSGMGADAIIGKAKRKLFAAVYGRLSGVVTPDGEADDGGDLKATSTAAVPSDKLFGTRPAAATGTTAAPPATATTPPPTAVNTGTKPTPETPAAASQDPAPSGELTPKAELIHTLVSSGVKFDDFRDFVTVKNLARDASAWASYDEIPDKCVAWFKANPKTLSECIKKFGMLQK